MSRKDKFLAELQPKVVSPDTIFKSLIKKQDWFVKSDPFIQLNTIKTIEQDDDDEEDSMFIEHEDGHLVTLFQYALVAIQEESFRSNDTDRYLKNFYNNIPGVLMGTYRRGPLMCYAKGHVRYYSKGSDPTKYVGRQYDTYVTMDLRIWTGLKDYYAMKMLGFGD